MNTMRTPEHTVACKTDQQYLRTVKGHSGFVCDDEEHSEALCSLKRWTKFENPILLLYQFNMTQKVSCAQCLSGFFFFGDHLLLVTSSHLSQSAFLTLLSEWKLS